MKSFVAILQEAAAAAPQTPLFVFPETRWRAEESLTYAELADRAGAAAGVIAAHAPHGDRALLLFPSGAAFWEAFFGCLSAGIMAVPLPIPNLNRTSDLLAGVCRDCRPTLLLTDEPTAELLERRAERHPYFGDVTVITPSQWRNEQHALTTPDTQSDSIAYLQYTSGSTSDPKGVQISHGNLIANAEHIQSRMQLQAGVDRAVTWLPHYHDMGLVGAYLGTLFGRITSWCLPPEEFALRPERWLQVISEVHGTICGGPDFGYRRCVDKVTVEDGEPLDLSSWRVAFIGAEKIHPETLNRFRQKFAPCGFRETAFFPCFGLAESTLIVTGGPVDAAPTIHHVSTLRLNEQRIAPPQSAADLTMIAGSGQTFAGSDVVIVDTETRTPLPDGQIGEICVSGPAVTRGYYNRDALNATLFEDITQGSRTERFLRTGDLGFLSGGELFITGRQSELIIIRGRNFHPEDIERQACSADAAIMPGGAIAFSTEIADREELVIAVELTRAAVRMDAPEQVAAKVRQTIVQSHGISPARVLLLRPATIPKTTSGKLRRVEFAQFYQRGEVSGLVFEDRVTKSEPRP